MIYFMIALYVIEHFSCTILESRKKVLFLVAQPLRGGGGKGLANKKK